MIRVLLVIVVIITVERFGQAKYIKGFEDGKNWVPSAMTRIDSAYNRPTIKQHLNVVIFNATASKEEKRVAREFSELILRLSQKVPLIYF